MTFKEILSLPRDEQALISIYAYIAIHPKMILQKVVIEKKDRTICIRCFFINSKNLGKNIITFNFFNPAETEEAARFVKALQNELYTTITGDSIF